MTTPGKMLPDAPGVWWRGRDPWLISTSRSSQFSGKLFASWIDEQGRMDRIGGSDFDTVVDRLPTGGWLPASPPLSDDAIDSKLDEILGLVPSDLRQHSYGVVDCVKRLRADWERLLNENHLMRHGHKEAEATACATELAQARAEAAEEKAEADRQCIFKMSAIREIVKLREVLTELRKCSDPNWYVWKQKIDAALAPQAEKPQ